MMTRLAIPTSDPDQIHLRLIQCLAQIKPVPNQLIGSLAVRTSRGTRGLQMLAALHILVDRTPKIGYNHHTLVVGLTQRNCCQAHSFEPGRSFLKNEGLAYQTFPIMPKRKGRSEWRALFEVAINPTTQFSRKDPNHYQTCRPLTRYLRVCLAHQSRTLPDVIALRAQRPFVPEGVTLRSSLLRPHAPVL